MTITAPTDLAEARTGLLLALADDELITGHRASHWTGVAPSLEEDLAFSTIAQDEINHADVWYQLAAAGSDDLREAVDRLALGRPPQEYRHAVLCERPPRDFAYTLARHWLYDRADAVRLASLTRSSDEPIAAVARRLAHEERFHLDHAELWLRRLTASSEEAFERVAAALAAALPEAVWLFEPLPGEALLIAAGVLPEPSSALLERWLDRVGTALADARLGGVALPAPTVTQLGGRWGVHSEDFAADVWPEMTYLHRAHPGAVW